MPSGLSPDDHNASKHEYTLVYPGHSRRAGGLSIGINLNPGKECNWACLYCEVDGLVRGAPAPVDLVLLEEELDAVLRQALEGRWSHEGNDPRQGIKDLCIAGDGEPTLSPQFEGAGEVAARLRERHGLQGSTQLVVITNGSRAHLDPTLAALDALGAAGGEIWIKVDAGTLERRALLNQTQATNERIIKTLALVSPRVPTWVQTMAVHPHADPAGVAALVHAAQTAGAELHGVLLYGLRRPSHQPGAEGLRALTSEELEAAAIVLERGTGLPVRVFS